MMNSEELNKSFIELARCIELFNRCENTDRKLDTTLLKVTVETKDNR